MYCNVLRRNRRWRRIPSRSFSVRPAFRVFLLPICTATTFWDFLPFCWKLESVRNQGKAGVYAPIDVYGPPGLSYYLKTIFQLTDAKQNHPCIVHEMYESENDPRLSQFSSTENTLQYSDKRIQMTPLFPEKDGFWSLVEVGVFLCFHLQSPLGTVRASSIHHTIECFGYIFRSSPPSCSIHSISTYTQL